MYDLPGLQAPAPVTSPDAPARPRLRVVPDVPLDFEAAVRTLTPRLVRYATRRLGDAHEAEEVVQEALLRAYKNHAELLTEDDLAAWSTCVTGRLVIDRLRVRGRSTSVADVPEGARVGRDTADVVVARDEARTALDSLDAMPARQAAVLWAREVEGLAYDEIGARFGMTEPAVRSILTRARKALRKEYASRGGTLPAGGLAAIAPWADGLGWLDRLRGAMGRMTAPAALSAVGVGILGGSMLLIPSLQPVTDAPHSVQTTVMTLLQVTADTDVLHGLSPAPVGGPPATGTAAPTDTAGLNAPIDRMQRGLGAIVAPLCTEADGTTVTPPPASGQAPVTLPINAPLGGQQLGVGDSECAKGESESRYEVNSPVDDPTGLGLGGAVVWAGEKCAIEGDQLAPAAPYASTPASSGTATCKTQPRKDQS